MPVTYDTALKDARLTAVRDALNAGTIEIGTAGMATVLAVLTLGNPCGSVSAGVLTFNAITKDSAADATGTAAAARIKNSGGTVKVSGLTVTASGGGGDIQLSSTSIAAGQEVSLSSASIAHA